MFPWIATGILWIIAAFYAFGALVHVANIAGMSGYVWTEAPAKWQVLDIIYLVLDLIVAVGLVLGWRTGYAAFFVAALSQIALYTVFRTWIVDVPEEFARTPEEIRSLDGLVIFHGVTVVLVCLALRALPGSPE